MGILDRAFLSLTMIAALPSASDIRSALYAGQFVLHYQPIVSLVKGTIAGYEALARWQHPKLGLLPPSAFIPVVETDFVLGREFCFWVVQEVCEKLRETDRWIAFNALPATFYSDDFPCKLRGYADAANVAPDRLCVEISENLQWISAIGKALIELKRNEFGVALDDFGTGYNSLARLASEYLECDKIKIDRTFTAKLKAPKIRTLARYIVLLAHELEMEVCAEGIETQYQASVLRELGCEYGQGYFYGKPSPDLVD